MDEFFNAIAEINRRMDLSSDRQTAKVLGISSNSMSWFRNGKTFPSDKTVMTVAELSDWDAGVLLASVHASRNAGEASAATWLQIRETLRSQQLTA